MPLATGFDVCRVMSQDEKLRKIPVILVSALPVDSGDFQENYTRFKELGVVKGAIGKPFEPDVLLAKIRVVTSK